MTFYLGTHMPSWFRLVDFPIFVSRVRLERYKKLNKLEAKGIWALDSGGFTELNKHGKWSIGPKQYIEEIKKYSEHIGNLQWAAAQDWMCEPFVLAKTGKTVEEHQKLTVENYLELMSYGIDTKITPVLQGWKKDDYLRHLEMYDNAGVDLVKCHTVGIGSVCRRQHTEEAEEIITAFYDLGIKIHGFGFKTKGLLKLKDKMFSSDSMAWSFCAQYDERLPGCTTHKNCASCIKYAILWREKLLRSLQ